MVRKHPILVEGLTAAGLIAAPFILPHLGFAPTTINRILVWGLFGLGFDILVRLYRPPVVRSVGLLRQRRHGGGLSAYRHEFPLCHGGHLYWHDRGCGHRPLGRPHGAAAHGHLFRHDHGGDRRSVLLRRIQSAVRFYRRRKRIARGADAEPLSRLHHAAIQHRLDALCVPGVLVFRRHGDRPAHHALADRRHPVRHPRQSAARCRRRPRHPRLQAHGLRHRRRLCRLCRRIAGRNAGLHAAGRLHVRHRANL